MNVAPASTRCVTLAVASRPRSSIRMAAQMLRARAGQTSQGWAFADEAAWKRTGSLMAADRLPDNIALSPVRYPTAPDRMGHSIDYCRLERNSDLYVRNITYMRCRL